VAEEARLDVARLRAELEAAQEQVQQAGRRAEQARGQHQAAEGRARRELERARHEAEERKLHVQVGGARPSWGCTRTRLLRAAAAATPAPGAAPQVLMETVETLQAGGAGEREQRVVSLTAQLVAARSREAQLERRALDLLVRTEPGTLRPLCSTAPALQLQAPGPAVRPSCPALQRSVSRLRSCLHGVCGWRVRP
jgi:hypothetical protein